MGLLQLNAMRLADIFSDDSNFRSYITMCFTEVLSAIFSLSHGDFLLVWCSSEFPVREEDASVEYEPFAATGWVLDTVSSLNKSNATKVEFSLMPNSMPQASYAHQRTSLFVKIIANLHCFVPNICEEQEKNLFLNKFLLCLRMDPSKELPGFSFTSGAQKAATVCRNLRSLLSHAESLIPIFLNDEDLRLLSRYVSQSLSLLCLCVVCVKDRDFFEQLELLINTAELEEDRVQIQGSKCEESLSCDKFSKLNINENHQEPMETGMENPEGDHEQLESQEDLETEEEIEDVNPFHEAGPANRAARTGLEERLLHARDLNGGVVKIEVADFHGKLHTEDYLDFEASLENYFEWKPMAEN
ncbi:hypothetical protein Pint_01089 [Pistacia integerrima]|uniref:Uncharacterized protein n=1 Tax=Pistacia integerrima TaxID=434235 RepID=A0ACC0ZG13_9ROSI|nr:hypothetical protein Pint_01089 [Pistacia integerrima]